VYLDSIRERSRQRLGNLDTVKFSPSMKDAGLVKFLQRIENLNVA